jgi:hypothetical protein
MALEALAEALAEKVRRSKREKPKLRLVQPARPTIFDAITRASILSRIRWLSKSYRDLQMLVDQATFNMPGLDSMEDTQLSALLRDLERARECCLEGIPFDDAELIHNTTDDFPPDW